MKANELRIGNLVKYQESVHNFAGKITTVTEIVFDTVDLYDAIPLIEEWLLKLGFKKNAEYKYFVKEIRPSKEFILDFSTQSNNWFLCDTDVDTNIKYVHQLQNLYFALTGEELELKVDALQ